MLLTDKEQLKLLEETDGPTTQKINKRLSEAEDRILKQIRPLVENQEEIKEIKGFIQKLRRAYNGIVK
jgi:predicted DNA-binding protein (UPF0278 family)